MPTIYDSYRIEWDGNSLYCENDVIIGYNATNKTRLEFVNTSPRTDVHFTSIEFRTPLSRIGFDLPDDGKIELSLNPVLYGADSDLALFWEADDGKTGAAHMRVMIVESEYYHDEETEAQADDNTVEINKLKARVSTLETKVSAFEGVYESLYEPPTEWGSGHQFDIGASGQSVSLSKEEHADLFAAFGLDRGIGFSRIFAEGLPAAADTRYELRIRLYNSETPLVPVTSYKYSWKNSEAYAPNGIRFVLNRTSGEFIARWAETAESPVNSYEWVPEGDSSPSGDTFNPNPNLLASVDTIEISASFDLAGSKFTFSFNALRGGN